MTLTFNTFLWISTVDRRHTLKQSGGGGMVNRVEVNGKPWSYFDNNEKQWSSSSNKQFREIMGQHACPEVTGKKRCYYEILENAFLHFTMQKLSITFDSSKRNM